MKEVEKCESEYQQNLSKINLENRLASVERGSKEELDLRLAGIEASRAAEIKAAEKTGADINLINAKFDRQRLVLEMIYAVNLPIRYRIVMQRKRLCVIKAIPKK